MRDKPQQRYRHTVAESRLFRIEAVGLRFANGVDAEFERLSPTQGGGAVLILPLTADHEILMIREYAVGTDRYELSLPKGRLESGEDPECGARRELREEIGYDATCTDVLRRVSLAPGYIAHDTTIILAREMTPAPLPGDEPEPLEVVPWPLSQLDALLAEAELTEARGIAALYLARSFLNQRMGSET